MKTTVIAVYTVTPDANRAIEGLLEAGFPRSAMSVLCAENARGQHFKVVETNKAAEGTLGGGFLGGALGALAAGLVAAGVVAAPGLGLVAAGPLLAALAGAGAGAAAGGLLGGLVGMGIAEAEAKVVDEQIRNGGILIAVDFETLVRKQDAVEIFEATGARTIAAPRA